MLYDNRALLSPSGELLAYIDEKRAKWYIRNDLAIVEVTDKYPSAIRLQFEPSGPDRAHHPFYLSPRENKCVVCGTADNLTRHHVVPQSFRRHFAVELKSRASHDVLAVCRTCHDEYNLVEAEFRNELAQRYNIHLHPSKDESTRKLASAARALLHESHRLPKYREDELLLLIIDHLDRWPEEDDLRELANPFLHEGKDYKTLSEYIVACSSREELGSLAVEWREHFVATMKPQFLPPGWDTHHKLGEETPSYDVSNGDP